MQKQKSTRQLKAKLTEVFNRYIRLRDLNNGCISCGKRCEMGSSWHAGHYYTRGANYANVVFDEKNVNGQCAYCNTFLEGNKQGYRNGLIRKYGEVVLNYLEIKKSFRPHWTYFEYETLIKYYSDRLLELSKSQHVEELK